MSTPDKAIPAVDPGGRVVRCGGSELQEGRVRGWRAVWPGCGDLPHADVAGARRCSCSLTGGSFGFQIGGQSTDLVLVAMNQHGLQDMLKNKFKLGADAAASAGPVGRNAQAGTDWKLNAEFLTYSRSKGLFAGIDLDGTVLSQNQDDTRAFYGANLPFDDGAAWQPADAADCAAVCRDGGTYFVIRKDNH